MLTKRMSEAEIEEALRAAALTRKVEKTTGGVEFKSNGAKGEGLTACVEVESLGFDATETADACKAWLLAAPRRLVAMGEIKFSQVGGEWVGDVNVEPKARKPRAAKV